MWEVLLPISLIGVIIIYFYCAEWILRTDFGSDHLNSIIWGVTYIINGMIR